MNLTHDHGILALASVNLVLGAVNGWIAAIAPIIHFFVPVSQIAVAVATVVYIARKTRAVRLSVKNKDDEKD